MTHEYLDGKKIEECIDMLWGQAQIRPGILCGPEMIVLARAELIQLRRAALALALARTPGAWFTEDSFQLDEKAENGDVDRNVWGFDYDGLPAFTEAQLAELRVRIGK